MTDDLTSLSTREMDRLQVVLRIADRRLTQTAGAQILGISDRQMRRICRRFAQEGAAGLESKRRGQSNRRLPVELRKEALGLVRARYADFGPTLAQEKLLEQHDIRVAPETLRQWMIDDGIWLTRRQRKKRVQQPRHRRDCYGELVQIDGSDHHWFEERGPRCVLLVYVDDATGKLMSLRMCESESAFSYFHATRSYLECHGKPVAFYSDKAGVFRVNAKRPKAGDGFTQFGRAMSELNIDVICANTPAAKGRVERAHQTLQDRLVKELRLREISTMDEANRYLPEFMEDYNRRFARVARNEYEDGGVSIRFRGVALAARPFHKDGCVTQASIVENKLLSGALEPGKVYVTVVDRARDFHFYHYRGSLTTPPFTETVEWMIAKEVQQASPEQVWRINQIEGDNARHVQPLYGCAVDE